MMRKLVSVLLLSAVSAGAMALGLGNIQLSSGLNQPFDARIVLLSPTGSELDSLSVKLADAEAFSRAGIERSFILTTLRFEVQQNESGDDYIRVTTREPLREPFLNFLIEASWANGKLYREYTVLLDPPLYDPNAGRALVTTATEPVAPATPVEQPVESAAPAVESMSGATGSTFSGNEVGPVSASETLWSVASRVKPDASVSVNQMMLALLRANPEAFIGNNINGLKQGQILRVPDVSEINSTSSQAALEEVRSQNSLWEDIRTGIAANITERPVAAVAEPAPAVAETPAASTSSVPDSGSELRLLAPGEQTVAADQQPGVVAAAGATSDAGVALANEQMESLSSENSDLRDRLTESEQIIQDLRRLIELKDDELATMQQQINNAPATAGAAPVPVAGTETVEQTEAAAPAAEGETIAADADAVATEEPATDGTVATEATDGDAAETPATEDTVAEQPAGEEPVAEEPSEPAPAPVIVVDSAPEAGLLDQILGFVFGNIILVGGGLIVIALLTAVPTIIRKRKEAAAEAEQALPVDFPDFDAPSVHADATDGPQMDVGIDAGAVDHVAAAEQEAEAIDPQAMPVDVAPATSGGGEEDPLAEVNVFLAYEHFDQAEEFVRDAITRQPKNLDFHSKLLEVFYSAGEKAKYEQEAQVLHDLTAGAGPHWDMAAIMWQEMSPNRPLFSEPAEGEEVSRAETTGTGRGIVDLTADDEAADDSALDFDLGMAMADSAPAATKPSNSDEMLDITAGSEDVLDVTASESRAPEEDILDVTAAVGIDVPSLGDDSLSLDLPAADDQDILDISASGADDPLDVTAHADLEPEQGENLLDISLAGSAVGSSAPAEADDNLLDFDVAGLSDSAPADAAADIDGGLEMDFGSQTDAGGDGGLELSLDMDSQEDGGLEMSLDSPGADSDGGIELDFASGDDSAAEADGGLSLDMGLEDELSTPLASGIDIDMDSTVKISKRSEISLEDLTDDDDDDNHTVFVPRTNETGEQSTDDENATKLDLAKAYVELGDTSNARSILEEVIAGGNSAQRQQAQELMAQI